MTAEGWSALVAAFALALGVFNFWYSVVRVWWREREASPAAELDLFTYQDRSGWSTEERVVVTNRGPAVMKAVEVDLFYDDGEPADGRSLFMWPKMPFDRLYQDQALYPPLHRSLNEGHPGSVVIRWADGRRGQQSRQIWLSHNRH